MKQDNQNNSVDLILQEQDNGEISAELSINSFRLCFGNFPRDGLEQLEEFLSGPTWKYRRMELGTAINRLPVGFSVWEDTLIVGSSEYSEEGLQLSFSMRFELEVIRLLIEELRACKGLYFD